MTEDEFECFLNETTKPINLFGIHLDAGTLLRDQDPIMFNEMFYNQINNSDSIILRSPHYNIFISLCQAPNSTPSRSKGSGKRLTGCPKCAIIET